MNVPIEITASAAESTTRRLDLRDLGWVATLLADTFFDVAPVTALFPTAPSMPRNPRQIRRFMALNAEYALRYGEGYASPDNDGVALWLRPGHSTMGLGGMFRVGMFAAPFHFGSRATWRLLSFAWQIEAMHKRAAPMPHYYLFFAAVANEQQGQGMNATLLQPMLARLDRENIPAYLETQSADNVKRYAQLGFRLVEEKRLKRFDDFYNWGMLRLPNAT